MNIDLGCIIRRVRTAGRVGLLLTLCLKSLLENTGRPCWGELGPYDSLFLGGQFWCCLAGHGQRIHFLSVMLYIPIILRSKRLVARAIFLIAGKKKKNTHTLVTTIPASRVPGLELWGFSCWKNTAGPQEIKLLAPQMWHWLWAKDNHLINVPKDILSSKFLYWINGIKIHAFYEGRDFGGFFPALFTYILFSE